MSGNNETELIAQRDQLLLKLAAVTKERDEFRIEALKWIERFKGETALVTIAQRQLTAETARADKLQAAIDGMEPVMWTNHMLAGAVMAGGLDGVYWNVPLYHKPEVK